MRAQGSLKQSKLSTPSPAAFTLIELIVVMMVLAAVMAVAAPSLSRFIHARGLEEEARRLAALTRAARSEAIARGVPMRLWADAENDRYGLSVYPGFPAGSFRPIERRLAEDIDLRIEAYQGEAPSRTRAPRTLDWLPDGTVRESPGPRFRLEEMTWGERERLWVVPSFNGLRYEIKTHEEWLEMRRLEESPGFSVHPR